MNPNKVVDKYNHARDCECDFVDDSLREDFVEDAVIGLIEVASAIALDHTELMEGRASFTGLSGMRTA